MIYRKIWEQSFGPIPKDEQGRSYEIHHIDSDKNNNNISNLMCISIDEHYKIHLDQGDYFSARLIASRMNLSDNELNDLKVKMSVASKGKPKRKVNCIYCDSLISVNGINVHQRTCIKNENRYSIPNPKISEAIKGKNKSFSNRNYKTSCSERNEKIRKKLLGTKQPIIKCPYCSKEGGHMMKVWHFDNCLLKPGNENKKRTLSETHKKNLRKPKNKKL